MSRRCGPQVDPHSGSRAEDGENDQHQAPRGQNRGQLAGPGIRQVRTTTAQRTAKETNTGCLASDLGDGARGWASRGAVGGGGAEDAAGAVRMRHLAGGTGGSSQGRKSETPVRRGRSRGWVRPPTATVLGAGKAVRAVVVQGRIGRSI
ncbi:hypothetical protein GCM10010187_27320 [Actinomadura coerulea]|nr:hypothetical protein GCM10010187_27320 [Actinomadura coerulea]